MWFATVTVTVHERSNSHKRVTNATVKGDWSNGGTSSCTTDVSGQCVVSKSAVSKKTASLMFTVSDVTHALTYTSADNHDADGDSNGTSITVMRP